MSRTLRGRALIRGRLRPAEVVLEDGRIAAVDPIATARAGSDILAPGFVDAHVHGGAGADFMDGTEEAAATVATFHARHGTTTLAATTLSGARPAVLAAVRAAAGLARHAPAGAARVRAVHLEGPYLDPARCGAQDPSEIRAADLEEVDEWLAAAEGLPCLMTVAPEAPGVEALLRTHAGRIRFALGHTSCSYARAAAALRSGAAHVTHLFNAMSGLHHRQPGLVGAALEDGSATVELIADGHHVHPTALALAARLLGERALLVTDAMRAAGMPDGGYRLYRHEVTVRHGAARLADGTLAGSVLTMDTAVRTMVREAGVAPERALVMATETPAAALGLDEEVGRLAPGAPADVVVLTPELDLTTVLLGGREVAR